MLKRVHLRDDLESELYFLGALYGAIDGLATAALDQVSPDFMGEWEIALAEEVQARFQRSIPISAFADSEHDWMRDPFGGEFLLGSGTSLPAPRVPSTRPVSFDDDDEPSRGIYDHSAYALLHSRAMAIVEQEFDNVWQAYESSGRVDPETFPAHEAVARAVRSVVYAVALECRGSDALALREDGNHPL